VDDIVVELVEVSRYRTPAGRVELMIAYRIHDHRYISPIAHFWMQEREDIRPHIETVVEQYRRIKEALI